MTQTLGHVVGRCISSLIREGRYSWGHDSIVVNMAKLITALKNVQVFVDIDQYISLLRVYTFDYIKLEKWS